MRKDRYVQQITEHLPYLRRLVMSAGLDYDEANEVLGKSAERFLSKKKYRLVSAAKLKAFLRTDIKFAVQHFKTQQLLQAESMARLPDVEEWWKDQSKVKVTHITELPPIEETECPFCFKANLNEHGACAMCHTIIPSHIRILRKGISFSEESLAVEFDFNTKIDVEKAIQQLTPFEQKVVRAVGLGNESLESFALDSDYSKSTVGRTWIEAKAKLQVLLEEYAPQGLSKRGESAFRRAMQVIERQREL